MRKPPHFHNIKFTIAKYIIGKIMF